jgi:CheY-like chemotaxis protein/HPt (histidine-containing phosphotransfer) domain-containing protein
MTAIWGMLPTEASSGEEALALMKKGADAGRPYRLILLDEQMPGMDGFEVGKRIKDGPFGDRVEILLLTSVGQKGDALRCRKVGIAGYLLKPIKQSELLDAIVMALDYPRMDKSPVITRYTVQEARRRLKILLAEDNVINRKLALELLQNRGHLVVPVSNGREALEAIAREDFDLVLMDVQMPEMDGLEATRRIRNAEFKNESLQSSIFNRQCSIPIIAMTAHAMKGDRERCLEAGMDDYVSKPIKVEELFQVIEKWAPAPAHAREERSCPAPSKETIAQSPEVFDLDKAMETVAGNRILFEEIALLFLEHLPGYVDKIREGLDRGDTHAVERAAHTLKGSIGNFGARLAYESAYRLEAAGRDGKLAEARGELTVLEEELGRLTFALNQALAGTKGKDPQERV